MFFLSFNYSGTHFGLLWRYSLRLRICLVPQFRTWVLFIFSRNEIPLEILSGSMPKFENLSVFY